MINFIDKNNKLNENKNSLNITYPRTVNIIVGYYPYPEMIHNFIIDIKNNLNTEMQNYTNVKGKMTDWNYFLNKDNFNKFLTFIINKHQISHPHLFEYFLEKYIVKDAWGNQIQKNDSLDYHAHSCWHGVLYLTKGCDLLFPELNLKITPEPGDYYIFPPEILHGFNKCEEENSRYSLIFNLEQKETKFDLSKKIKMSKT
mgnify:CR=1 FL=1|tara:strand:+ start:1863 stop:2462 length:600 start_codon:yes stop_codon:yes gene_type:complete